MSDASGASSTASIQRYGILKGPNGLRAAWRLLIFIAILVPLGYAASLGTGALVRGAHPSQFTPMGVIMSYGLFVLSLLLATWIMGRIEGRAFADYGLPWRAAFGHRFWQGAAFSFASLTLL